VRDGVRPGPDGRVRALHHNLMHDLSTRATHLAELMDDPDCDRRALDRTYRRFTYVNAVVAGWRATYRDVIRPLLSTSEPRTLLDVGCGGGDVSRALARGARRDGLLLEDTGVEPDARAQEFDASVPPRGLRSLATRVRNLTAQ